MKNKPSTSVKIDITPDITCKIITFENNDKPLLSKHSNDNLLNYLIDAYSDVVNPDFKTPINIIRLYKLKTKKLSLFSPIDNNCYDYSADKKSFFKHNKKVLLNGSINPDPSVIVPFNFSPSLFLLTTFLRERGTNLSILKNPKYYHFLDGKLELLHNSTYTNKISISQFSLTGIDTLGAFNKHQYSGRFKFSYSGYTLDNKSILTQDKIKSIAKKSSLKVDDSLNHFILELSGHFTTTVKPVG